jgi:hypothetical protein
MRNRHRCDVTAPALAVAAGRQNQRGTVPEAGALAFGRPRARGCYDGRVKLPFDRARMRERNRLDDRDEIRLARSMTPQERWVRGLELSELALALARANPNGVPSDSLEDKARRWTLRRLRSDG